jgi:hypothetical protein
MACRGFVPPKVTQLSLLRADSGLSWKGAEQLGADHRGGIKVEDFHSHGGTPSSHPLMDFPFL